MLTQSTPLPTDKRQGGSHGLSGLLDVMDGLSRETRPYLVRGDGTETVMSALEARDQGYLFKLSMTKRVKELVSKLAAKTGWTDAGRGWQAASSDLQLQGWSCKRRVVVLRRPLPKDVVLTSEGALGPFGAQNRGSCDIGFLVEVGEAD